MSKKNTALHSFAIYIFIVKWCSFCRFKITNSSVRLPRVYMGEYILRSKLSSTVIFRFEVIYNLYSSIFVLRSIAYYKCKILPWGTSVGICLYAHIYLDSFVSLDMKLSESCTICGLWAIYMYTTPKGSECKLITETFFLISNNISKKYL